MDWRHYGGGKKNQEWRQEQDECTFRSLHSDAATARSECQRPQQVLRPCKTWLDFALTVHTSSLAAAFCSEWELNRGRLLLTVGLLGGGGGYWKCRRLTFMDTHEYIQLLTVSFCAASFLGLSGPYSFFVKGHSTIFFSCHPGFKSIEIYNIYTINVYILVFALPLQLSLSIG